MSTISKETIDLADQIKSNPEGKPLGNSTKLNNVQIAGILKFLLQKSEEKDEKISVLEKEIEHLKGMGNKVDKVDKKLDEQAEATHIRTFHLEKKDVAPCLVMKNIPQAENETKEQLFDLVKAVFNAMEVPAEEYEIKDVFRIRRKKPVRKDGEGPSKEYPPLVKVRFRDAGMKGAIFSRLTALKGTDYEKVSIENEVPASVRREYAIKQKEAYEIRKKSNFTTKTRIDVYTGHAVIKIKMVNDEKFRFPEDA